MLLSESGQSYMRRKFAALAAPSANNNARPLETVLLVGAAFANPHGSWGCVLTPQDEHYLAEAFRVMAKKGCSVAPGFTTSVINTEEKYGGEDFLASGHKADLVVSCFIFNPATVTEKWFKTQQGHTRSPLHDQPHIWHDSAEKTGAQAVFVVGGAKNEIHAGHYHRKHTPFHIAYRSGTVAGYHDVKTDTALLLRDSYMKQLGLRR